MQPKAEVPSLIWELKNTNIVRKLGELSNKIGKKYERSKNKIKYEHQLGQACWRQKLSQLLVFTNTNKNRARVSLLILSFKKNLKTYVIQYPAFFYTFVLLLKKYKLQQCSLWPPVQQYIPVNRTRYYRRSGPLYSPPGTAVL